MRIALLHDRVRLDEKMLLEAAEARGVEMEQVDVRRLTLDVHEPPDLDVDAVLVRSLSLHRTLHATRGLEAHGIPVVNPSPVVEVCGDKAATSQRLAQAGVPTPRTRVAFTPDAALDALDDMGYPAVIKPVVGSWGRLLARVGSREQARTILEHKRVLGGPQHGVLYLQEYVEKPQRDLRAFVVDGHVVAAIRRENPHHWITNTAQGGTAANHPVTKALRAICMDASHAIGGGVLAMDLMETPDGSLTVHEVNHGMEFKNSVEPTGVDIPGHVVEHVMEVART